MGLAIPSLQALWFLPFALPICFWVAYSDLTRMKIPNRAVLALAGVFLVVGLVAVPLDEYPWRLLQLGIALGLGILFNAAGMMGAGDSKFIAAAAPFVPLADLRFVLVVLAASLLGAFAAHRIAKHSALRRLAPDWASWSTGKKFPMGLALAGALAIYLILGALYGAAPA